jgi:YggT family protein
MLGFALFRLINLAFQVYALIILVRVIGSWLPPRYGQTAWATVYGFCYTLTEPLLRPIRSALDPLTGRTGFDFSPLVLWVLLEIVRQVLLRFLTAV